MKGWRGIPVVLLIGASVPASSPAASRDDEQSAWALWEVHAAAGENHSGVIKACQDLEERLRTRDLALVAKGIRAWHLLKAADADAARTALTTMLRPAPAAKDSRGGAADRSGSPLAEAADQMARTWLTRLDREQVKQALRELYLKDIRYPARLDLLAVPAASGVPLTDRWGDRWSYELTGFQKLRQIKNQRYRLESERLGRNSDLAAALDLPYAAGIGLRPVRLILSPGADRAVEFVAGRTPAPATAAARAVPESDRKKALLCAGSRLDGVLVAYVGARITILCDGNHWLVSRIPGVE